MSNSVHKLAQVFAVLRPNLAVEPVEVSPGIYQELDARFDGFKGHLLVSEYEFSEDWSTWERHPAGDEVVVLLSGEARMVLRGDAGDEVLEMTAPGSYVIVPVGTWHTARVSSATRMLFITPGEGTENRADI